MTVYIDVLFIVNMVLDYFILLSIKFFLKTNDKRWRLLIGAITGALYSCFMFFPKLEILSNMLFELLLSCLIVFVSFRVKSFQGFLKLFVSFYVISALFGGIVFAIEQFIAPPILVVRNSIPYLDISPILLIAVSAVCYIIVAVLTRFVSKRNQKDKIIKIEIYIDKIGAVAEALIDTGNELKDSFSGCPVIICEFSKVKSLIPLEIHDLFLNGNLNISDVVEYTDFKKRFRMIPYSSVSEDGGLLPAFKPDYLICEGSRVNEVIVAVTSKKLSAEGNYNAIISPEIAANHELIEKEHIKLNKTALMKRR